MFGAIIGIVFGLYVAAALVGVIGLLIGAVFSGAASLFTGAISGKGIVFGIVIGYILYRYLRNRNAEREE